jgi:hypothetical protein
LDSTLLPCSASHAPHIALTTYSCSIPPRDPAVNYEKAIDKCVEEVTIAIQEALAASASNVDRVATCGLLYPPVFRMKYA